MLLVVTVTANSKQSLNVGSRLIRAEAVYEAIVFDTTGSQFYFPLNDRDRQESPTKLTCSDSVTDIKTGMDLAYNSVDITLPVHPFKLTTNAVVDKVYNAGDIVWGVAYPADTTKSLVKVQKGAFEVVELLVDYTLAEIVLLAETGSSS